MRLFSSDVESGILEPDQVLAGFGCDGANRSPALAWTGAPKGTASFVVSAYDPDAPTGSGFWHWSVFNIPASATFLPEGAGQIGGGRLPEGSIQARNDLSLNAYSGACPPPGRSHRYIFTVFAMPEAVLPLDETASAALVGFFANTSALGRASLTATYGRAE
ncbi:YbhB/YbcL family Raf kinase inhibitor-like protein [Chthonobacter albigriseus]|uniref:YbhB/YbcL family Raf kinase inhibitor-like protein n=1 Tax=Chthonobacter albigriseus TaxID=1683161 RepID=UPI0015EF583B|nr:YbhB/YbcL family Raf kinase inhibitor-like protein [Chthonobacter albigriseus]